MQVTVPTANMWMAIFIIIMQMVYSAVHYAHDWFCCNYAGNGFCYSFVQKFQVAILYSFPWHTLLIKPTKKTFKRYYICCAFHHFCKYSSNIKILWGYKLYTNRANNVILYFRFPDKPVKARDILDFQKGGNLRKGGMITPTNYE